MATGKKPTPTTTAPKAPSYPGMARSRGIKPEQWSVLTQSLYPGARDESVCAVWDYCVARCLDPLRRPVHIVPMNVQDARTRDYGWRDVIMSGIGELRITAQRTGRYAGVADTDHGDLIEYLGARAFEWVRFDLRRVFIFSAGSEARMETIKIPGPPVYFVEACQTVTSKEDKGKIRLNKMWAKRPIGQLYKCAEAAALRAIFPDEIGDVYAAEEMWGATIQADYTPEEPDSKTRAVRDKLPPAPNETETSSGDGPTGNDEAANVPEDRDNLTLSGGPPTLDDVLGLIAEADPDQFDTCLDVLNSLSTNAERKQASDALQARKAELSSSS